MICNDITVVTTSFNDEKNIKEYLECFFSQTLQPKELIIADGGSSDKTIEIIEEVKERAPFKLNIIKGKKLNIAQGFNLAIKNTNTKFVLVSCIGNFFDRNFIYNLYNNLINENADIAYGPLYGRKENTFSTLYTNAFLQGDKGKFFSTPSNRGVLIKKSIFEKIGYFKENLKYAGEDSDFYINRLSKYKYKIIYVKDAKLYWGTPKTFNEYLKKRNFYCLADMQLWSLKDFFNYTTFLCLFTIISIIVFLLTVLSIIDNNFTMLILFLWSIFYIIFSKRIKTFSLKVFLFRIYDSLVIMYYHLKYIKYFIERNNKG